MKIFKYLITRFTTLKPPLIVPENPIKLLRTLNRQQTAFFFVGFLAWTWDAFDFFSVTLNIGEIGKTYHKSKADITWGITITLMLRSVGAVIFGIAGDRFGRKWPFIINIVLYAIIEICTGFCATYTQFIILRAFFGIAMGGIYGNCAATALEDAPIAARGLLSGLLQQGYACGYLLAAAFNLAITDNQPYRWRALFWFGGCPPLLVALWRVFLPETESFLNVKNAREAKARASKYIPNYCYESHHNVLDQSSDAPSAMQTFLRTARLVLKEHWPMLIYLVLMMTGFNFLSHGSQDLYPTFLSSTLQFSNGLVTVTTIVANCGAIIGGMSVGYFSSFFGRRLSILVVLIIGALLIPAYVLPHDTNIMAGAFFLQMCVQGVWGVVPIHLIELSPPDFRSFVVGTAYQLGNLISSASSTIEAKAGQHFPKETSVAHSGDEQQYDYSKVIAIFLSCVYIYLFIVILLGPEKRNNVEATTENSKDNDDNEEYHDFKIPVSSTSDCPTTTENVEDII
jgi:SHS family lactate transporter-like MFS transporter